MGYTYHTSAAAANLLTLAPANSFSDIFLILFEFTSN